MYMAAIKWRKEIDLDKLYETFDWDEAHRASRVGYVQYFHKTDRSGSPIHIHELHTIDLNKLFKAIVRGHRLPGLIETQHRLPRLDMYTNTKVSYPLTFPDSRESGPVYVPAQREQLPGTFPRLYRGAAAESERRQRRAAVLDIKRQFKQ